MRAAVVLLCCVLAVASGQALAGTAASRACTPTLEETEGPYYKAGSPLRGVLAPPGTAGTRLVVTGVVLGPRCKPVPHAWLDFWQADANGAYDNAGYRLRGHQFANAAGRYRLVTVVPGLYPGRTRHIHVKVRAPGGPVLTSQLYFPGTQENDADGIFDPSLVLKNVRKAHGRVTATFTFVVPS